MEEVTPAKETLIFLSIFCCKLFIVMPGTPAHREAIAKGLIEVPPDEVDEVNDMSTFGRRRWGMARTTGQAFPPGPFMPEYASIEWTGT